MEKTQEEMRRDIEAMMQKANGHEFAASVVDRTAGSIAVVVGFSAVKKDSTGAIAGLDPVGTAGFLGSLLVGIAAMRVRKGLSDKRETSQKGHSQIAQKNSDILGDRITSAMEAQTKAIVKALEGFEVEEITDIDVPNGQAKTKKTRQKRKGKH